MGLPIAGSEAQRCPPGALMRRGEIWWARMPVPSGRRPVVLVSRNVAYVVRSKVTVVEVTTRMRGIETELRLGTREGLPRACCANADNLITIDKSWLDERIGALGREKMKQLDRALVLALGIDHGT
jgi:mRNA interferase MazF